MRITLRGAALLPALSVCLALDAWASAAFDVTVDTTFLSGTEAVLAFDFSHVGPPPNSVTLSALTSNGTQQSTSPTGDITGGGPWAFGDGAPLSELLVDFNPMGSSLSFSFTTSDNPPNPGPIPDSFSFFVLEPISQATLINTVDPTGADALFLYSLGQGASGLLTYTAVQPNFSLAVTQVVPEPGSLALIALAAAAAIRCRARRSGFS